MAQVIAAPMANGQIFGMAVTAFTQGLDVFKRCGRGQHMFATNPARNQAVHLPGHRLVHFVAGVGELAHCQAGFIMLRQLSSACHAHRPTVLNQKCFRSR